MAETNRLCFICHSYDSPQNLIYVPSQERFYHLTCQQESRKQLDQVVKELKEEGADYWLGELLAVIHRDGGHYQDQHGSVKAIKDAIEEIHRLRAQEED